MINFVTCALIVEMPLLVWLLIVLRKIRQCKEESPSRSLRMQLKHAIFYHHLPLAALLAGLIDPDFVALFVVVWNVMAFGLYWALVKRAR